MKLKFVTAKEAGTFAFSHFSRRDMRANAGRAVALAIADGRLKREPCCVCGKTPAQAHHDDYSKPLTVAFLCVRHHKQRHREIGLIWKDAPVRPRQKRRKSPNPCKRLLGAYLFQAEKDAFADLAESKGFNVSEYIRHLAHEQLRKTDPDLLNAIRGRNRQTSAA